MTAAIDLTALDREALRDLIARSRAILRDRRPIPDTSLRRQHALGLTDAELALVRRAARRFGVRPATLAEMLLALRATPQVVTLRSRDGQEARLTPLIHVHWAREGTALTGTGHLTATLTPHTGHSVGQAAPGESVPLTEAGAPDFSRRYGPAFIRAWAELPALPTGTAFRIILAMAGHTDTPQEALLTWCVGAVRAALGELEASDGLIDAVLGRARPPGTLAALLRPALARVRAGATPREVIAVPRPATLMWADRLVRACELFLVGTNLIVPDLETDPVLDIPLAEVWQRGLEQERLATLKAGQLRRAVVRRFGFTEISSHGERAWVRATAPVPRSRWALDRFLRETPNVLVTETCRVYVSGQYRCVVEGLAADLPHADQVVRRLLAVATRHRERSSTLRQDLPLLNSLFANVADAQLWDLATEPRLTPAPEGENDEADLAEEEDAHDPDPA